MTKKIPAGEFKAHCLQIMDLVKSSNQSFIITKRNVPVAKIVPLQKENTRIFGSMKGTVIGEKDIISSTGEVWNADTEADS